jgi:hypothetical protein
VIPNGSSRAFNEEGDYLEAEAVEGGILLKPVAFIDTRGLPGVASPGGCGLPRSLT